MIRWSAWKCFTPAIRPKNFNDIDSGRSAQSEMEHRFVAGQVAHGRLKQGPPTFATGLDRDFCANGVAPAVGRIQQTHAQGVASIGRDVAKEAGRTADRSDHEV